MMRLAPGILLLALTACAETPRDPLKPAEAEVPAVRTEIATGDETSVPGSGADVAPTDAEESAEGPPPATTRGQDAGTPPQIATTNADERFAAAQDAPHIYMSLQPDPSGPTSVVFAIDASRDATPSDDPAIRITPEGGACNLQDLRRFNFPAEATKRPVFGPDEVLAGLTARDLPNFMAIEVTSEMLRVGLITQPEESKPQNVCARKLWQQLVAKESLSKG